MTLDVRTAGGEFEYGNPAGLFETKMDNYDAPERYVVSPDGLKFLINVPVEETAQIPINVLVNWDAGLK